MTEPLSTKFRPFSYFTNQPYGIFTEDFCHEKLFVLKPTIQNDRSIVKVKETVTLNKGAYNFAQELRLWFKLPKAGTLYAKLKSTDYV